MTTVRRAAGAALALALLVAGCGVRPTGVLDGGEAAGGLTKGLRLYFVSTAGRLEAVGRPEVPVEELDNLHIVLKYLGAGPTEAELRSGLATLVDGGVREIGADGDGVTLWLEEESLDTSTARGRNRVGQLVCSLARARAVSHGAGRKRTDDITVTVKPSRGRSGTFVCSDFLK
ncbi:GerMN domain-containing protein [Streptomyces sp. NPDC057638]|uniref:GerMN domain-containing protein n=1 Tax=Streptomyces sp. NPDC057638 TaxID=3346190 RepID=UPI003687BD7D